MQDLEMKKKVAQEIIALMDEKEGERLKKHPKLAAAAAPKVDPVEGEEEEMKLGEGAESADEPSLEVDPELASKDEEELSPELIQKLLEMMKDKQV